MTIEDLGLSFCFISHGGCAWRKIDKVDGSSLISTYDEHILWKRLLGVIDSHNFEVGETQLWKKEAEMYREYYDKRGLEIIKLREELDKLKEKNNDYRRF